MKLNKNLTSALVFKLGWLACAFGAARGQELLGPLVVLIGFLTLAKMFSFRVEHFVFALSVAVIGSAADSLLLYFGFFEFPLGSMLPWAYPVWMSALWFNFAGLVLLALAGLDKKFFLTAALGLVGGPMSYIAGSKIGSISLAENETEALVAVAVFWALIVPALFFLKRIMRVENV